MHNLVRNLVDFLPQQFRVLYRQFLLRIIDLEALSIQADIPRFLGQISGVLIMFSMIHTLIAWAYLGDTEDSPPKLLSFAWHLEHHLIAMMMLVVGLIAVASWDSIFPDRRDTMILGPLPVKPSVVLAAKAAAAAAVVGLAIVTLNVAAGFAWPSVLAMRGRGPSEFLPTLASYWLTMIAASVFVYGSVLTVQGLTALLLPRRLFLLCSAFLQLAAFAVFFGVFFLQPTLTTPAEFANPSYGAFLSWAPSYWFFALFNRLRGALPENLNWLATRAWIGLAAAVAGSVFSLLLCYLRTMRKTIEQPDLLPAARGPRMNLRLGSSIEAAILAFSFRSVTRSRQHRVVFAFYMAIVLAVALSSARSFLAAAAQPLAPGFLVASFVMMSFAVLGLRSVFSLPISLTANWMLRISQLFPSWRYIAATRHALLCLTVLPVWITAALLSLHFRPWPQVAGHLIVLALLGSILADLSLIGFYKVPFTCSYLPGKVNIQFVFWGSLILFLTLSLTGARYELAALHNPVRFAWMVIALGSMAACLRAFNRYRARDAEIYFEEVPAEVITSLRLISLPSSEEAF